MSFIDFDVARNVARIRPFLGVALVGVFALGMFMMLKGALDDLVVSLHSDAPKTVEGTIRLENRAPIGYGSLASFRATVHGAKEDAMVYISTACFQGETLVFQRSVQPGVKVYLTDQPERDLEWDGGSASCSATLLYRMVRGTTADVYVLDSISFDTSPGA